MRAIIVDDEPIMLRSFMRLSSGIPNLNVIAQFGSGEEAIFFVEKNAVELAILDIRMPVMNGIELAVKLREIRPNLLIVFISAYDEYVFVEKNAVELAILDIRMPVMNGIELAVKLREIRPNLLIVFISAYDEYVRDSNMIGGD